MSICKHCNPQLISQGGRTHLVHEHGCPDFYKSHEIPTTDSHSRNCKTIAFQPLKIKLISDVVSRNMKYTCPNCGRKMDEREIDWENGKCRICVHD